MPTLGTVNLGPVAENLAGMVGAARDAFNRHSRTGLERFKGLQEAATKELQTALKQGQEKFVKGGPDQEAWARCQSFISRLQVLVDTLGGLWDPISKKVKDNVLFSEKAVTQTNCLFDRHAGLIRSLFDIAQTDNEFLKKFVVEEARKIVKDCADYADEHETRLIEGLCTPQAAPIFLTMLDRFRSLALQEEEIVQFFGCKS